MRQITLVLLITLASSALADEWLLETSDAEILGLPSFSVFPDIGRELGDKLKDISSCISAKL